MSFLNSVSEYQEALKTLLDDHLGEQSDKTDKAEVVYPSDIRSHEPKEPQVILDNLTITKVKRSGDGRREAHLAVDILVRVPTNIEAPELMASDIAFYICALLERQRFGFDAKSIEVPTDIEADGLPWSTHDAGYHISFSQIIRVGGVEQITFGLSGLRITKVNHDGTKQDPRIIERREEDISSA
ncbi:hypothetical protein P7F88_25010 [Vibrio hannami]|uniref:hypothetical protein n=1 Tax=Vibrio hannami TaxID=2717094 RepID=UPI00240FE422|nr:hypothetical protein [Vibrio hannami]MDG3089124.1 hypothetical protein [Vibrio hannami]